MGGKVLVEHAEPRCDLGQGDLERLHESSIAVRPVPAAARGRREAPNFPDA